MKYSKDELQKLFDSINKKQTAAIITLLVVPGGIPILLWYLYKKYKYLIEDFEIIIQRKDKED